LEKACLNFENNYNFATAMQRNKFILNNLLLIGCLISLSAFGQTAQNEDTLKVNGLLAADTTIIDTSDANSDQVNEIIEFAKTFMGTPYKWAGTTPSGFDCSGFIYYVFGNFGFGLVRTSTGMAELGETVKLADIQPGDLMFFKGRDVNSTSVGHVAMVVEVSPDAIKFIHSSSSRGVVIDNFKTSKYYIPRFIKAKRLDYGEAD
jgi:cell wall-associated NlpC family hydrolase